MVLKVKKLIFLYLLTHLSPRVGLYLRKLELSVVGVHLSNLLTSGCAQDLREEERKTERHHKLTVKT